MVLEGNCMKILIVVDIYGWAFENLARDYKKYSKFSNEIEIKAMKQDLVSEDFEGFDMVLIMNYNWFSSETLKALETYPNCKFVIWNTGHSLPQFEEDYIAKVWAIIYSWKYLYSIAPKEIPTFFINPGVDPDFYSPVDRQGDEFIVGWCGDPTSHRKRIHLLSQLNYPLKVKQSKLGFSIKNRDQTEMQDFFKTIDVYISVSHLEGSVALGILEAMSCGLPVISTNVGDASSCLDEAWILPIYPEIEIVRLANEKLERLMKSPELRKEVGERNRETILKNYNWKILAGQLDKIIEEIYSMKKRKEWDLEKVREKVRMIGEIHE